MFSVEPSLFASISRTRGYQGCLDSIEKVSTHLSVQTLAYVTGVSAGLLQRHGFVTDDRVQQFLRTRVGTWLQVSVSVSLIEARIGAQLL